MQTIVYAVANAFALGGESSFSSDHPCKKYTSCADNSRRLRWEVTFYAKHAHGARPHTLYPPSISENRLLHLKLPSSKMQSTPGVWSAKGFCT
eukprot:1195815-Prorocentrum_minimum.AAC.6